MKQPIVFFDSGMGGTTLLREAQTLFPHEDLFYYGDTAHVPYGSKSESQILDLVTQATKKIQPLDPKALVLACNTATTVAAKSLRESLSYPVIGMEPAIKPALKKEAQSGKRVLLIATQITCQGQKLRDQKAQHDPKGLLDILPTPDLVDLAEVLDFSQASLEGVLHKINASFPLENYSGLVLGCTHFIFFKEALKKSLPQVHIYDGNAGTLRQVQRKIQGRENPPHYQGQTTLYFSAPLSPEKIDFFKTYLPKDFNLEED
ncbi:MAG: glutamate racemase [Tissierellia bacterium]|nr:glutamate racemase [Tissierellia bacterium]